MYHGRAGRSTKRKSKTIAQKMEEDTNGVLTVVETRLQIFNGEEGMCESCGWVPATEMYNTINTPIPEPRLCQTCWERKVRFGGYNRPKNWNWEEHSDVKYSF